MERKLEEGHQEIKDSGYELSEDGLTLVRVTNAALDGNGHFTIPEGVTEIGNGAFYGCTSLTTVRIPGSVTKIENGAFALCISLTTAHIPGSVTKIGERAFYGCTSLTTVHIPEGVTKIGQRAFYGCTSLTTAHIPGSVTAIGIFAFVDCTNLTTVHISEGVTYIGYGSFFSCENLVEITIPESVTSIADRAFTGCKSLTTVHIPEGVTYIEKMAFYGCTRLTNVIIKTDNEAELNRIKNLLPENLRDKVISRSVYEIQRGMVDRFSFEAAGGAYFNNILCSSGLPVTNINQIIASYLPEAVGHILKIINEVGIPAYLPNDESKITYHELLVHSLGRFFPNFNAAQANDQKQVGPARLLIHEEFFMKLKIRM